MTREVILLRSEEESCGFAKSAYDALAPRFERERALPDGVAQAVRELVLEAAGVARPRVLDLGAGTGRIGWPFVAAGDDYVGVDLSFGMLRAFMARCGRAPRLVQADGLRLPFAEAMFDLVMLVQVFGGLGDWRQFADEARRVLRPDGAVVIGRTAAPEDGVDARMKLQLDSILSILGEGGAKRREMRVRRSRNCSARARLASSAVSPGRGRRNARRASSSRAIATVRASRPCPRG